jgi:transcriptional regulator with XRE-family HTH domain
MRPSRRQKHLTQAALAERVGVHQTWISAIELGRGGVVPLETWVGLGVALDRPLAIAFSRATDPDASITDAGHLQIQEALLELARLTGRRATAELPTRPLDPRHSTDVALRDDRHRVLILAAAWNTFGDLGAAIRSTHRKQVEAADLAVVLGGDGDPYRVATVWVVSATATNRRLVARFPNVFAVTFDGSSRAWSSALTTGAEPPTNAGLVWFDAATGHIRAWRGRVEG